MSSKYELIIVGGGPAGLTAGIYATMARIKTLLIEKAAIGGKIMNADKVENFPGFPEGISGMDLGDLMQRQAAKFGLEPYSAEVTEITSHDGHYRVKTTEDEFFASSVILAGGSEHNKLEVPGESEFVGKGISYCATCDANFFREQTVAGVSGGNAAVTEAHYITPIASKVFLIHRRDELRASRLLQERALAEPKITILWDTVVNNVLGQDSVQELELRHSKTGKVSSLTVQGIFIAIGFKPNTAYLQSIVMLDKIGQVLTNTRLETDSPGIFAAGDIRSNSGRQAIIAAGDGAAATLFADNFLRGL